MVRAKRIFLVLTLICSLGGINTYPGSAYAQSSGLASSQITQVDTVNTNWENYQEIPDTFRLVAENSTFRLFANEETLAFKVVDKRSGYIWHSNLDVVEEHDRLNKTWTAFASSGISINYLDVKAISDRASITNAERTINFEQIEGGFEAVVDFHEPSISVGVTVRLDDNGVSVEVPFESIQERGEFRLGMLYLYPFFGATRDDSVPGYMFIPDGSGSLIRFNSVTKAENMYYGRYYGADLGMIGELPFDPTFNRPLKVTVPVTGMVHGYKQNAYIAIVEKGAPYGEIQAHPAGVITNFNFLCNAFIYNQSYFHPTNRSGAGVTTLQPSTNKFDVRIVYRFLTGDASDYVGMARSYQQYLVDRGVLKKASDPDSDIGVKLEFLGAEKERVLFWYRPIPMTTINQMEAILADLAISNIEVVYYGWQPGGAFSVPPKTLKLDSRLGEVSELKSLIEQVQAGGGNFYLYLDPQAALLGGGGYSPRNDLALAIMNENLIGFNRYKVNYYYNYEALKERYTSLSSSVFSQVNAGLAIDIFGSMLYTDFNKNRFLNRVDALEQYQKLLAENAGLTAFYYPSDYMFGYASAYYDIPLGNNGYIYTTDIVPFLQIVLSGYIPYYGPAMNFSSNSRADLLRQADFGVYPSFFLTHEVTAKILNTSSEWIYSSSYAQWEDDVKETYRWLNDLLSPVKGESITAREVLVEGVVATTYSNGHQIIVNYNDSIYSDGDVVIKGKDAVIRKVSP